MSLSSICVLADWVFLKTCHGLGKYEAGASGGGPPSHAWKTQTHADTCVSAHAHTHTHKLKRKLRRTANATDKHTVSHCLRCVYSYRTLLVFEKVRNPVRFLKTCLREGWGSLPSLLPSRRTSLSRCMKIPAFPPASLRDQQSLFLEAEKGCDIMQELTYIELHLYNVYSTISLIVGSSIVKSIESNQCIDSIVYKIDVQYWFFVL